MRIIGIPREYTGIPMRIRRIPTGIPKGIPMGRRGIPKGIREFLGEFLSE